MATDAVSSRRLRLTGALAAAVVASSACAGAPGSLRGASGHRRRT